MKCNVVLNNDETEKMENFGPSKYLKWHESPQNDEQRDLILSCTTPLMSVIYSFGHKAEKFPIVLDLL